MTTKNPILDELRTVREKLLADAGGTLDGLVDRLQAEEKKSTRPRYHARKTVIPAGNDESNERSTEKTVDS